MVLYVANKISMCINLGSMDTNISCTYYKDPRRHVFSPILTMHQINLGLVDNAHTMPRNPNNTF